ncbi:P-loop NTPase family protein [Pseudoroseomonas sp. WGS1072]|uniref:hypothetical protein n=1 Tax=Roseomonas sp. WGS1072 TaxID=3366816 RepID=UPI003BF38896
MPKLDQYRLWIFDETAYVSQDQSETSVIFELVATRHERQTSPIAIIQPFGGWRPILLGQAMTLSAVAALYTTLQS